MSGVNLPLMGSGDTSPITLIGAAGDAVVASRTLDSTDVQGLPVEADQISASDYQSTVSTAIDNFIQEIFSIAQDNSVLSKILQATLGLTTLPSQSEIDAQYATDSTLLQNTNTLINNYNQDLANLKSESNSSQFDGANFGNSAYSLNADYNQLYSDYNTQYQALVAGADFSTSSGQAAFAAAANQLISNAETLYNGVVQQAGDLSTEVGNYNTDVASYNSTIANPTVTSAGWAAAQAAIVARNSSALANTYGTLPTLGNFQPLPTTSLTSTSSGAGPGSITWPTVPSNVTQSQLAGLGIDAAFTNAISSTQAASQQASQVVAAKTSNDQSIALIQSVLDITKLVIPTLEQYQNSIFTTLYNSLSKSTLNQILQLLGLEQNPSQDPNAIIQQLLQGFSAFSFSNPSGGAVATATSITVSPSELQLMFQKSFERELQRQTAVTGTGTGQSSSAIPTATGTPVDPYAEAANVTAEPGNLTAGSVGLSYNVKLLSSDFENFLAGFSVMAAATVSNNLSTLDQNDPNSLSTSIALAFLDQLQDVNPSDLKNRVQAILLAQNPNISSTDLQNAVNAVSNVYSLFLTAFQGSIANTLAQNPNLSTAAIAATIASAYVKSTQVEATKTQARQVVILKNQQNTDNQLKTLVANLPKAAYLTQPAALASAASSGQIGSSVFSLAAGSGGSSGQTGSDQTGGGAPTGATGSTTAAGGTTGQVNFSQEEFNQNQNLGAALASSLPTDENGNFAPVSPEQLYNALSSTLGAGQVTAPFIKFVQNEPEYQIDQANLYQTNHAKGAKFAKNFQLRQQQVLTTTVNKSINDFVYKNANIVNQNQIQDLAEEGHVLSESISNPTLAEYYKSHLLTGQNSVNTGIQVRKDNGVVTPDTRSSTQFLV